MSLEKGLFKCFLILNNEDSPPHPRFSSKTLFSPTSVKVSKIQHGKSPG